MHEHFFVRPRETLELGIPALAYTVRSVLLYVAIDNLDAATYTITYQLKVFTAAVLTVLWLKRRISIIQWTSLFVLIVGVAIVIFVSHFSSIESFHMRFLSFFSRILYFF
jgi:drug/metabolite transporter (DMT)-like permease